jgi:hypothetical protein
MDKPRFAWAALVLVLAAAGPGGAQGLGDAAKKEKAKRTDPKPKEPAKVYTNDTILSGDGQPSKGTFSSPAGDSPTPTSAADTAASPTVPSIRTGSATSAPQSGETGESYWRSRVRQAQAAIAAADRKVKDLETQANKEWLQGDQKPMDCTTTRLPGESGPAWRDRNAAQAKRCEQAARSLPGASGQLDAARGAAAAARKALDDLYEEARRAGALPGWLR